MTYQDSNIVFEPIPTIHNFINLTGQVFGLLTVLRYTRSLENRAMWQCLCECGDYTEVSGKSLRNGHTRSCGHLQRDHRAAGNPIHGGCHTPEYTSYVNALMRCTNPNHPQYKDYGGRGIEFRFNDFPDFYAELGKKPLPNLTVNRIDNDGHYEKGNVEWADEFVQAQNRRNNCYLTIQGTTKCLMLWAKDSPLNYDTIRNRLRRGFCDECAVFLPCWQKCSHQ